MKNKKILIGLLVLVLLVFAYLVSANIAEKNKTLGKQRVEESPKTNKVDTQEEKKGEQVVEDITFLMMGVDEGERSDTIIVCKYFGSTGKISVLSIPRDTRTEIPGHGLDKLNHANAYEGPELSLKAVNSLLNMNIENYIKVDYALVKEVVDTIGGVDIYIPKDTHFWTKGDHHLDGDGAVEFLRYRAGYANQDLGRIASQQEFLKQVFIKMKDTQNVLGLSKMMKLGMDNINTNIPIKKVISYGVLLKDTDTSKVDMRTLPGVPKMINRVSYIVVDQEQIPKIVEELFLSDQINIK